jgi:hypothetical protein
MSFEIFASFMLSAVAALLVAVLFRLRRLNAHLAGALVYAPRRLLGLFSGDERTSRLPTSTARMARQASVASMARVTDRGDVLLPQQFSHC